MSSKMSKNISQFFPNLEARRNEQLENAASSNDGVKKDAVESNQVEGNQAENVSASAGAVKSDIQKQEGTEKTAEKKTRGRKRVSRFGKVPKRYPFQLSQELYDAIQKTSFEEGISVNQFITKAVMEKLDSFEE